MSDFMNRPTPEIDIHSGDLQPICRIGDTSDHGGAIAAGSPICIVEGIPQARKNDSFVCGISSHNPAFVGEIMSVAVDEGMDVCKNGDMSTCGATFIASQEVVFTEDGGIRITSPTAGSTV